MHALNDDFRVHVTRLNGHFTSDDRAHVDATLARARCADLVVIDLRYATFDHFGGLGFLRERIHPPGAHVRVIVAEQDVAFDALETNGASNGRVHILRDVDLRRPNCLPGVEWEEVVLGA